MVASHVRRHAFSTAALLLLLLTAGTVCGSRASAGTAVIMEGRIIDNTCAIDPAAPEFTIGAGKHARVKEPAVRRAYRLSLHDCRPSIAMFSVPGQGAPELHLSAFPVPDPGYQLYSADHTLIFTVSQPGEDGIRRPDWTTLDISYR